MEGRRKKSYINNNNNNNIQFGKEKSWGVKIEENVDNGKVVVIFKKIGEIKEKPHILYPCSRRVSVMAIFDP